jgi:hypothetical protein
VAVLQVVVEKMATVLAPLTCHDHGRHAPSLGRTREGAVWWIGVPQDREMVVPGASPGTV